MEERPDPAVAEGTQVVRRPGGNACAMNGAVAPSTRFFRKHCLCSQDMRYVCGWATGRSRTRFCSSGWSPTPARPGPWARRRRRGERQPPRRPRSAWGAASPMGTSSSSCPQNFCGQKSKRPPARKIFAGSNEKARKGLLPERALKNGRILGQIGEATQDPPDPAAPRRAPEPELTACNA